jgi:hypothetical protein
VRVQGDGADVFCISAGGLAGVNGTRTPSAHGKARLPLNADGRRGGRACAKHKAVSRKVPRTTANDNEADLRVSITRFYSTRCSEAKLRGGSEIRGQPPSYDFGMPRATPKEQPSQLFIRTHNETLSLVPVCSDRKLKLI